MKSKVDPALPLREFVHAPNSLGQVSYCRQKGIIRRFVIRYGYTAELGRSRRFSGMSSQRGGYHLLSRHLTMHHLDSRDNAPHSSLATIIGSTKNVDLTVLFRAKSLDA